MGRTGLTARTTFEELARVGRQAPGRTLARLRQVRVVKESVKVDRDNRLR